MAKESQLFSPTQVLWFTVLISKKDNVDMIRQNLQAEEQKQVKVVEMSQGQKSVASLLDIYGRRTASTNDPNVSTNPELVK